MWFACWWWCSPFLECLESLRDTILQHGCWRWAMWMWRCSLVWTSQISILNRLYTGTTVMATSSVPKEHFKKFDDRIIMNCWWCMLQWICDDDAIIDLCGDMHSHSVQTQQGLSEGVKLPGTWLQGCALPDWVPADILRAIVVHSLEAEFDILAKPWV